MKRNINQVRGTFREEAYELLAELELTLIELEKHPGESEYVDDIFRDLHTIKGSGAMCGFDTMSALAHELETAYERVRDDAATASKELIDVTLAACDQMHELLEAEVDTDIGEAGSLTLITRIKRITEALFGVAADSPEPTVAGAATDSKPTTYNIDFAPATNLFHSGTNPIALFKELRGLGECSVVANTGGLPALGDLDPELCYTSWSIELTTDKGKAAIEDVFIFVADRASLSIVAVDEAPAVAEKSQDKMDSAVRRHAAKSTSSIRVPAQKLDDLIDRVGELVTVQARLTQMALGQNDPELISVAEEVERLTDELRENTLGIRMLPLGTIFNKFRRLVRDLSYQLGHETELTTSGEETELDKTVIDRLDDPLIHLIRNSLDHGIEPPDERTAAGKPRQGRIHLSAEHSGPHVYIRIQDDGRGIDREAVREKALERGLIEPDEQLSDQRLLELTTAPGFSTAKQVTSVSGRGVGMDVVKRSLEALGGRIEMSTEKGSGTTITLRLPLTLAIIDGLLVEIGDDSYVLPLSAVNECVELSGAEIARGNGRRLANVRGELISYIRLRDQLELTGQPPPIEHIVIAEVEGKKIGFVVDKVIGQHQTVIKTLGKTFRDVEGISGATILGDGSVALIMDIPKLVRQAEEEELSAMA